MQRVMNTAPRTDALGEAVYTAEQRRAAEAEHEADGSHQLVLCARHDESGELVGYTELTFGRHRPWLVQQGDTAVDPAHRNMGLGRWLKAASALRLLAERPDAQVVETWNDGSNAPMLNLNTEMGFRTVATWHDAELALH
jgi:mycothiol synthase